MKKSKKKDILKREDKVFLDLSKKKLQKEINQRGIQLMKQNQNNSISIFITKQQKIAKKGMDQLNRIHQSITSQQNTNLSISSEQVVLQLENKVNELFECEKIGDYVKAESIKMTIEELKKEIDAKRLKQLIQRQKKEKNNLEKENQRELQEFNAKWNQKMLQFDCQKEKQKKEMTQKHAEELAKAKIQVESQFSTKMKESSECLNFRKIQEQLKKQRKYSQAHEIQKRVEELQIRQKKSFEKQRQMKIQTALQKIKNKQKAEVSAWQKKNESGQNQLLKDKQKQLEKIRLKNNNSIKDMILKHQKEVLAQKGKLKNRASLTLSKSPSKYSSTKRI